MKKRGERILGPYEERGGWRVIEVYANGKRTRTLFESEQKAQRYIDLMRADLSTEEHTTDTALDAYLAELKQRGTKDESRYVAEWMIRLYFPTAIPLSLLSKTRCQKLYDELTTRKSERTGEPFSIDTHRNARDRTSCFLSWCVGKGWLRVNPIKGNVRGIGKRRKRGKSLGKAGNELRVKHARAWYTKALDLATRGDESAVACLCALLLGMRAHEIVQRKVNDLDEDAAPGDLLWIPCSKTPAGRRTLEVPEVLRPLLVRTAGDRAADRYLFEKRGKKHTNQWLIYNVRRICRLAGVPEVTTHAMRGLLATLANERGMAGHLIAATLGHESYEGMTNKHYAAPGSATAGALRKGWAVLDGGAK